MHPTECCYRMSDLLSRTKLSGEQEDLVHNIQNSADALLHLIDDILDLSKIEAGKIELIQATFDLRKLVEDCVHLFAEAGQKASTSLVRLLRMCHHWWREIMLPHQADIIKSAQQCYQIY